MFSDESQGLVSLMTSPVVVFVIVPGKCPRVQNESLLNRSEMTWDTFESMSEVNPSVVFERWREGAHRSTCTYRSTRVRRYGISRCGRSVFARGNPTSGIVGQG